jgi:hypothetical protein
MATDLLSLALRPEEIWVRDESALHVYRGLFPADDLCGVSVHVQPDLPTQWVVRLSDNTLRVPGLEAFDIALARMQRRSVLVSDEAKLFDCGPCDICGKPAAESRHSTNDSWRRCASCMQTHPTDRRRR